MRILTRKILEHALCVLAMAMGALAVLYPMVTSGDIPISGVSPLYMAPWDSARPADTPLPQEGFDTATRQYYPWHAFLNECGRERQCPLWSPVEGCGQPFYAIWRTRCLSPFSVPMYLMPLAKALQFSAFLKLFVAGLCAFIAARRLGFTCSLSLFVAFGFELSGYFFLWLSSPLADTLPWLPLLLIYVDRLAIGRTYYWPYGSVVFFVMLLGGEPEAVAGAFLLMAVFIIARVLLGRRGIGQLVTCLGFYAFSLALAAALAAIQIAPFVEFLRHAASTGAQQATAAPKATDLLVLLLPHFFSGSAFLISRGACIDKAQVIPLLHVGMVQLLALPLWFALRRFSTPAQRQRIEAMIITVGVSNVVVLGLWGFVQGRMPFSLLHPEHLLLVNALFLSIAAAAAAEEWTALNAEECLHTIKRFPIVLAVLAVFAAVMIYMRSGDQAENAPSLLPQILIALGFSLAFLGLVGLTLLRPSMRIVGYAMAGLAFLQLFLAFHSAERRANFTDPAALFPETRFVSALKTMNARVCGSDNLRDWPLSGNGIAQAYSASGVSLKRHAAFFGQIERDPLLLRRTGSGTLMLTKADMQGVFAEIRPILSLKHVLPSGAGVFEDLGAKPRAWVTFEGRTTEEFDPAELAADQPPIMEGVVPPQPGDAPEAKVTIGPEETHTNIPIHVETDRDGVLILADTWYPGWEALIDGQQTVIFPVDGMFRGVSVPRGSHEVVFRYRPESLRLGFWVTVGGWAVILASAVSYVIGRVRNRRQRDAWTP